MHGPDLIPGGSAAGLVEWMLKGGNVDWGHPRASRVPDARGPQCPGQAGFCYKQLAKGILQQVSRAVRGEHWAVTGCAMHAPCLHDMSLGHACHHANNEYITGLPITVESAQAPRRWPRPKITAYCLPTEHSRDEVLMHEFMY